MSVDSIAYDWETDYRWHFQHHRGSQRDIWFAHRNVESWPQGLYTWMWNTFGPPGPRCSGSLPTPYNFVPPKKREPGEYNWDYSNGKLIFNDEKYVTIFLLRWL